MRNLVSDFKNILEICKSFAGNLVNEKGNVTRRGVVPKFSDLEVIALSITAKIFCLRQRKLFVQLLEKRMCRIYSEPHLTPSV